MIRNYLKIALRNLVNNKVYSFINIGGLALGIATAMLIGLWIWDELSYDDFHPNEKQLHQVLINGRANDSKWTQNAVNLPLADAIRNEIPEVKHVVETNWKGANGLKVGDKKLIKQGNDVLSEFFSMFQFKFIEGDPKTSLQNPESIVLTAETAQDLFGNADPMNKIVRWNNIIDLKVTGIVENMPKNSYFKDYQYFMPFSSFEKRESWVKESRNGHWNDNSFQAFVELQPNASYTQVEPKIRDLIKKNNNKSKNEVMFYPIERWRLWNKFENWKEVGGRIEYVKMFGIIGFLVLLIACINFMNLSTARSAKRAKEVGIRKSVGSLKSDLVVQFIGESLLVSIIAFGVALALISLALPTFNQLIDSEIIIPFGNTLFWIISLIIVFITGLLAGSYPAIYLSSFSAIRVLKGTIVVGKFSSLPRKVLVVMQFTASIALIISTVVIYQQIKYAQDRPAGYNPKGVMLVDMKEDLSKNYDVIRNELIATGVVENVTRASSPIHAIWSNWGVDNFPGKQADESVTVAFIETVPEYFKTLEIKFKEGRDFYKDNLNANAHSIIINEAAAKRLRLEKPLGQILQFDKKDFQIIGLVENTIMQNPFENVGPAVFVCDPTWASTMMFRIKHGIKPNEIIAKISPIFNKYNPAFPFEYQFADDEYGKKFKFEVMIGKLAGVFALLAILISCLGLFGLSAYIAEQRTKEIGIRKVLGASIPQLWAMLSKDFIILVILASLIASPIAVYFLKDWLGKYRYRIELNWIVFISTAVLSIVISLLTVSYQSIKTALMNPVNSLKSE